MKTDIPAAALGRKFFPADYSDAFLCDVPEGGTLSPDDIQCAMWTAMPGWVDSLMKLRNLLVKPLGLKTDKGDPRKIEECIRSGGTYGSFSTAEKNDRETVLLLEDKHLKAWMSVMTGGAGVYCITVVKYNNRLGRVYFFLIRPFHAVVVRSMLKRAVGMAAPKHT